MVLHSRKGHLNKMLYTVEKSITDWTTGVRFPVKLEIFFSHLHIQIQSEVSL